MKEKYNVSVSHVEKNEGKYTKTNFTRIKCKNILDKYRKIGKRLQNAINKMMEKYKNSRRPK